MAPKVRGRRSKDTESKKEQQELASHDKALKLITQDDNTDNLVKEIPEEDIPEQIRTPFFGLVESQELEYFKNAESTLNINAFDSNEDRALFVNSVIEESQGKELKLVTNQICSKLIERLILFGTEQHIKVFYTRFNGHFAALAHNKYASHCIETLFKKSAELIEKNILNNGLGPATAEEENEEQSGQEEEIVASIDTLFLYACGEFKPYLKEMIKHQYASHVLRLAILILSGREIPMSTEANSILRSKKSKIARKMIEIKEGGQGQGQDQGAANTTRSYKIPTASFFDELKDLLSAILHNQSTKTIREACIAPVSSPTYSLILSVEGIVLKERPYWDLVFAEQDSDADAKEEAFVEYCLSDAVGSHFLQNVLKQSRAKNLNRLYQLYIQERVLKIAKRTQTGSYIIQVLLTRLNKDTLVDLLNQLIDNLNVWLSQQDQKLISSIITISQQRKNYRQPEIVSEIFKHYGSTQLMNAVLKLETSTLGNTKDDWPTSEERRDAFFLESLLNYDDSFVVACIDEILSWNEANNNKRLFDMCNHGVFSHVIQQLLSDPKKFDTITRRKVMNCFMVDDAQLVKLSCNSNGSHIMDSLWVFSTKLTNYKERIIEILISNKEQVKNSMYGKWVWKNWSIDMYIRKKFDWKRLVKDQEFELFPPAEKVPVEQTNNKQQNTDQQKNKKRPFDSGNNNNNKPAIDTSDKRMHPSRKM